MKRLAAAFITALALAGSAGADIFTIVPNGPTAPLAVPSPLVPNQPGTASFSLTPPAVPQQLAYPQLLTIWQQAGAFHIIPVASPVEGGRAIRFGGVDVRLFLQQNA